MNQSQIFALNHHLIKYPKYMPLNEILTLIDQRSNEIVVSSLYENQNVGDLVSGILILADDIEKNFFSVHELVTVIDKASVYNILMIELDRKPTDEELIGVCSFLDTYFSCNLPIKIKEAVQYLKI
jgi:hypothetical protein